MATKCENQHAQSAGLETAPLKPAPGWSGWVALSDSSGNCFTIEDWARCLADPISLCSSSGETIKADAGVIVSVKKLKICDKTLAVVVKSQQRGPGFRNLLRSLLPARAIRNFRTALRLYHSNVPVARPLAALRQKNGPFTTRSIYITEYIQSSGDLHAFLRDNLTLDNRPKLALKKQLCSQIARIFASLHNASLWHRDAKANNFLIYQRANGQYKVMLVDMDGIKRYGLRGRSLRFRGLAKLAATLLWHRSINTTDYLRTFTMYSNLTGLDYSKRRRVFRSLARRAVAIRLLTLAKSAMEGARSKESTANTGQTIKRILIIKPSALGDIVLALPALASLRASFPDARISWFIRPEYAPLLAGASGIDDVFLFDRKLLGKWWYNRLLTEHGVRSDRYAVFVPGSAHVSKCWPVQNFAALADEITSRFDLSIIVIGTSAEKPLVRKLKSASNVQIADFAGLTDIPQLTALLNGAKVVVSNDTGPGHIAAALGVPVVIIFGATNPARISPYRRPNTVAAVEPDKRGSQIKSSDPRHAIEAVTVEHVLEKVTYQLEHYAANSDK